MKSKVITINLESNEIRTIILTIPAGDGERIKTLKFVTDGDTVKVTVLEPENILVAYPINSKSMSLSLE